MKILVTGCAGFIGSHLCEKLLNENYFIWGIDNLNNYYDPKIKKRNLEILMKHDNFFFKNDDLIHTNIINDVKPDIVVNIGAMAGVRYSLENPEIYMKTNVEGQTHLLNESVKNNVKLFVYASSSSVYGLNKKVPFSESDAINLPNSPYAESKKMSEMIANTFNRLYNIPVIGLRFFTVYGPRGRPDMAPYKFIDSIMNDKPIDKYGNGESMRDYTYIDDIVSGIVGAIRNKNNRTCEVYNLGNSNPITLNDFISVCENVVGKKAIINQKDEQKGDVPMTYADITKAKNDLDYDPKTDILNGILNTFNYMKNI